MDELADRIALYEVFLPLVRQDMSSYVRTWNSHQIRKQKKRPAVIPGKPWMLFNHPPGDLQSHGLPFQEDLRRTIGAQVFEWGKHFVPGL